ncbi:MAG: sulfatase-like hydrolase/transferase [Niameybacter sp.]
MQCKNVLFLIADDQRFDTIRALGNQEIHTPYLDKLVKMGTTFTNAHIPSGTSGAVCMPSRAMIHSGRTLFHIQGEGQNIPNEHSTLGETLKNAGYYSCGIGKWHNGIESYARSFNDGDDIFFGGMWDHWHVPISHYDTTGKYDNKKKYTTNFQQKNVPISIHCDEITIGVHSTDLFTQKAMEKLEHRPKDQPFFMCVSYLAPHDPRTMPEAFQNMYQTKDISLPKNFVKEYPFEIGIENIRAESIVAYPRDEEEIKQNIADYYAMISHLDASIGTLVDYLEAKGELEDTLIVFTGDNGLAVGQHGYMAKQSHYEHSVRVPLVMAGASMPQDKRIDSYVYLMDIYPTICEWMGIEIPESVESKSLVPLIRDEVETIREHLYFAFEDLIRSVKYNGFKLIHYKNAPEHTQLFNVVEDPDEIHNLYNEETYSQLIEKMTQIMNGYKDTWENTSHKFSAQFWGE